MNIILAALLLLCIAVVPSLVVVTAGASWALPVLTGPILGAIVVALVLFLTPGDERPLIYRPQGFTMTLPRINTSKLLRIVALMTWFAYMTRVTLRAL